MGVPVESDRERGLLTSLTRRLDPRKAVELYERIAPVFVHRVLDRLGLGTELGLVHRIVAHLCEASTQQRLREQAHVRDGIVAEFRLVLGADVVTEELTRARMDVLLEESGALDDLEAMENCLKLAGQKAG